MDEHLQIGETQDSASSREHKKGVEWCQIGPSRGEGAETPGGRVVEEDPWFTPGKPLGHEGKLLTEERMEGMGDRKDQLSIRVIGCS